MSSKKTVPTLTDIAKAAGVSVMTVSRALRDAPKVSDLRKDEIKRIAEEMGYRPNPEMSRLMTVMRQAQTRRSVSVMALLNTFTSDILENNNLHLKTFYEGARKRALSLGFTPQLFSMDDDSVRDERLSKILFSRGIESVVVLPFPYERRHLHLDYKKFYVAAIGRSQSEPGLHRACPNQFQATRLSLQMCEELGYKRPGLILRNVNDERSGHRYSAAYLQYFHEHPSREIIPILTLAPNSTKGLKAWMQTWQPDVILGLGPKTLSQLKALGYGIPEDLGFINLMKVDSHPETSGVDNHFEQVGAAAVDLVVNQMHSFDRGLSEHPKTVLINGSWVDGKTTRPTQS